MSDTKVEELPNKADLYPIDDYRLYDSVEAAVVMGCKSKTRKGLRNYYYGISETELVKTPMSSGGHRKGSLGRDLKTYLERRAEKAQRGVG